MLDKVITERRKTGYQLVLTVRKHRETIAELEAKLVEVEEKHYDELAVLQRNQEGEVQEILNLIDNFSLSIEQNELLMQENQQKIELLMFRRRSIPVFQSKATPWIEDFSTMSMNDVRHHFNLFAEDDVKKLNRDEMRGVLGELKRGDYHLNPEYIEYWKGVPEERKRSLGPKLYPRIYSGSADEKTLLTRLVIYLDLDENI